MMQSKTVSSYLTILGFQVALANASALPPPQVLPRVPTAASSGTLIISGTNCPKTLQVHIYFYERPLALVYSHSELICLSRYDCKGSRECAMAFDARVTQQGALLYISLAGSISWSKYYPDFVRLLSRHWLLKDYLQPSLWWRGSNQTVSVV